MSYAICRLAKCKAINISAMDKHNERKNKKYSNEDIDISRTKDNIRLVECSNYRRKIEKEIKERYRGERNIRRDAVLGVETIFTSDQEFFQDLSKEKQIEFFKESLSFLEKKVGKQNIISAVIHYDETTPHLHAVFVPLDSKGKLRYKSFVENKQDLIKWQDEYYQQISKKFPSLERGKSAKDTQRKHLSVADFKEKTELEKEKESLKKEINDLKRDYNTLEKDNERKKEEFQTIQKQLNESQKELERKKQEVQKLQDLEKQKKQLEQSYYSIKQQYQGAERELDRVQEEVEKLECKKEELEGEVAKTDRKNKKAIEEYKEMLAVQEYTIRDIAEKTIEKETIEKEISVHKKALENVLELRLKKDPGYEKDMEIDRLKTEKKMLEIDVKRYEKILEWFDNNIEGFKEKREEIRKSLISNPQKKNPWEKKNDRGGWER